MADGGEERSGLKQLMQDLSRQCTCAAFVSLIFDLFSHRSVQIGQRTQIISSLISHSPAELLKEPTSTADPVAVPGTWSEAGVSSTPSAPSCPVPLNTGMPALNLARRPPAQRSCGNGISLKHKTWSLSPSVQSVSVMKATLLVLLLSAVAVMLTCDHQHSEREAGPGCPLGKRLAFDLNTTLEESKRLNNEYFDCPNPEPGAPCFYYSHVFYPFFVIEDTVVGESDRFHDSYTFKVVGGGRTRESVRNYSQEEILKFNSLRDRWLCQRNSPCGDLTPVNHLDPDFYFVVEVSNMETAGSPFCEYTVRFELHVHGFPLDPVRALFFHQMTMTFVQTILICYIGHTCWRLKRKTVYTKTRDGLDEQDFFIVLMTLLDFVLSLVQSGGGFSSRQASTLFRVLKTLKGARVFRALRLIKAIRFFKGLQDILLTCLQSFRSMSSILVLMFLFLFIFAVVFREMFNESDPEHFGSIFRTIFTLFQILTLDDWSLIYMTSRDNGAPHIIYFMSLYILVELFTFLNLFIAVLVDNFQLSIRKKRHHKSQKSPDVKEGEAQSTKKAVEDLDVSLAEIEEEFYKEALRHASSDGKHSKRSVQIGQRTQIISSLISHSPAELLKEPTSTADPVAVPGTWSEAGVSSTPSAPSCPVPLNTGMPALNLARRPPAQRSCGNGISLKHKTWSLSPSVQSVSVMKATLLVLLLSAVAVMLTCDHQHSEREAGPGCPLGKRLAFDLNTTLEESKRLNNEYFDCPNPEPGAPCFYYSHVFYPFFVIEDTVVGESDRFHDSESYQQTLVWTFDDVPDSFPLTKEGFIVMRGASNRVRWLCQRNSPCGDLTPVNHLDPDFYFVVEVSNMETAGSPFCEYTVRFELHVHGFPLDPVRALFFHQNPVLDHVILLVVLLDTSTLMAHTFQSVTVTTSWCLSAVNSCLLVFYVLEALFKILIQGRTYFRNPWNDLDFFIVLMTLLDFVLSLVQSGGGFSSRQASTLFRVLKTLKGARVFRALRLIKAIRFFKGLQDILLTCLQSFRSMSSILVLMFLFLFIFAVVFREMFNESDPEHFGSIFRTIFTLFQILTLDDWSLIYMTSRDNGAPHIIYFMSLYILVELFTFLNLFIAVLVDNFQLSIRKKRHHKSQKSPDVKEGEAQSTKKAVEDLDVSLAEIEEEFYKEALRHASSDGKHSKRKIELTKRYLQLLAAMDQHAQKYRSQACLLDNLVETFFMDQDEETRSDAVE
ncbi:hypothetical protein SRHO_G00057630 [Serrasalmus rhombeus]